MKPFGESKGTALNWQLEYYIRADRHTQIREKMKILLYMRVRELIEDRLHDRFYERLELRLLQHSELPG